MLRRKEVSVMRLVIKGEIRETEMSFIHHCGLGIYPLLALHILNARSCFYTAIDTA